MQSGADSPNLDAAERRMLDYTRKLTLAPKDVSEEDLKSLRECGFSDSAILAMNAACAYMNFANRVAQGLGVELEDALSTFTR
jgi:uncharacterized peroxidase-related enzyme